MLLGGVGDSKGYFRELEGETFAPTDAMKEYRMAFLAGLCLVSSAALSTAAKRPAKKAGPEALPAIRQPVCYWWDTMAESERNAFVARFPALAKSFAFHKKIFPRSDLAARATDESLGDWWLGREPAERTRLVDQNPGLKAALRKLQRGEFK